MDLAAAAESPSTLPAAPVPTSRRELHIFWTCFAFYVVGLLVYSQTMAFVWDEGFHLLAAQLIDNGKIPYIDFCFPQTLLNAYWNAAWMHVFGQNWRVTHIPAALLVAGTVYLTADYVLRYFPVLRWRLPCALAAFLLTGLNDVVIAFGPIAQAYAAGLFLTVAAFRAALNAASRNGLLWSFACGVFTGSAAGCTLLTAPVVPVFLLWLWFANREGSRWKKLSAFCFACAVPFAPMFWLLIKAPRQTFFNVIQYQAIFRRVNWPGATTHDIDVLTAWLNSASALLLGLFAIIGLVYLVREPAWRHRRSELYLCAWLSGALIFYIATAHPTFQRYFIFAVPFCAILAVAGLVFIGSRLASPDRPLWPATMLCGVMLLSAAKVLFDDRDSTNWKQYETIAAKIAEVTPPNGLIYADEQVYFVLHRTPPPAMEFSYSHKLELSPKEEQLFHIVSERELNEQVKAGKYATVESCKDDRIDEMHLAQLFPHQVDINDCSVFWGKVKNN